MSDQDELELEDEASLRQRILFRLGPSQTLIVFALAAAVFGAGMLFIEGLESFPFWLIVFFFAIMLWLRSAWALTSVFVILFAMKFFPRIDFGFAATQIRQLEMSDLAFTFLTLMFAGASLRFLEIDRYNLAYFSEFGANKEKQKDPIRRYPTIFGGRWIGILIAIAIALFMIGLFPLDQNSVAKYWIKPRAMRVIFMFGALFLIWFVIKSLFSLVARLQMDSDQASILFRSIFANEYWKEHRGIESRREKINRKQMMAIEQREIYDVD